MSYAKYSSLGESNPETKSSVPSSSQVLVAQLIPVQSMQHRHKLVTDNPVLCTYVTGKHCPACKVNLPKYAEFAHNYRKNGGICVFTTEDIDLGLSRCNVVPTLEIFAGKQYREPVAVVVGPDFQRLKEILDKLTYR